MTDKINTVDLYVKAISEQVRKESGSAITESLEAAEKKVLKKDPDAMHIASHGTQHAFAAGETDRGEAHYYMVHDTATGKTHGVALEHGGEVMSHDEVKKEAGPNVHPEIVKAIHKDHKQDLTMSEQTAHPTNIYVKAISEQARKENGFSLSESTEVKAAKAYASHEKLSKKGYDNLPLHHGDGFYHKDGDGPDQTYIIKHKSGRHSMTDIDHMSQHKNKADYEKQSRQDNPHLSDDEHKEVAELIHKNFN